MMSVPPELAGGSQTQRAGCFNPSARADGTEFNADRNLKLATRNPKLLRMPFGESPTVPITEQENPRTANLSTLSSLEIVRAMNDEDATIAQAIQEVLSQIAQTVDRVVDRLRNGGRLFYIGTGTSGRLGVLDAAECPPTFGVPRVTGARSISLTALARLQA